VNHGILLSALRINAILSFGKRTELHGAKFAALVVRGNRFVIQPEVHDKTGQAQGSILTATRCMFCC